MKLGVYIGGFCPLHRGHLDVIMRAKKENDQCLVVVYGYDNEPRAKQIGLTTLERYNMVKQIVRDSITRTTISHWPTKPEWDTLLDWVYRYISTIYHYDNVTKKDIIVYTGEPVYHTFLMEHGYNAVMVNACIPTNGTAIRNNPYNYMDYIAQPFKQCFSKVILLSGASSTGKSTCARDLATYFNAGYSEEYSRRYVEEHKMAFIDCTADNIKDFIKQQYCQTSASAIMNPLVFADGDTITNLTYAKHLLHWTKYEELEKYAIEEKYFYPFTKVFIFKPEESEFTNDGIRDMASSYKFRLSTFKCMLDLYEKYNVPYEVLSGSYYENFNAIKNYVNS